MKILALLPAILLSILLFSCSKEIEKEGFIQVDGGKIWYKIVGEGEGTPLLTLHGGPGGRSCGMMGGSSLLGDERPVIFYDQLGSGNSDRPGDSTLWKIERFANEIDHIRKALRLKEVHILGHSCGSTVLSEYMISNKPKGVKSVIFSSPMISTSDWIADAKILLAQLPQEIQDTINKYESIEDYSSASYLAATDSFYSEFLIRSRWPYTAPECEGVPGFNSKIYNYMWGPTEFTATGTLIDFDRSDELDQIEEPILFVTGEFDEARPETMYKYQKMAKNAEVKIIENAAHATYVDQPTQLIEVISEFLKKSDNH